MKRRILTTISLIAILALLTCGVAKAGRVPPRGPARDGGCLIDFRVYGPLMAPRAGLRVWVNSDESFVTTSDDGQAWIWIPVTQFAQVLRVTDATGYAPLWAGGARCDMPGTTFGLEAYVK